MARTPIHPGEHLAEELKELRISAAELARQLEVPVNRITEIMNGQSLKDLAAIGGNRLEALKGDRAGQYSIRINDQWRICFEWPAGSPGPVNVEITDYH